MIGYSCVVYDSSVDKNYEAPTDVALSERPSGFLLDTSQYNYTNISPDSQDTSIKKSSRNQLDMDYLAAVKSGDMEAVKRLVDEAAMEWGAVTTYENGVEAPMKVYHTTDAEFTRFQKKTRGND